MLHSLSFHPPSPLPSRRRRPPPPPATPPPTHIKFDTTRREHLRYLKSIGVLQPTTKLHNLPSPNSTSQILSTVRFLKSKGFADADFPRLASAAPDLFSPNFDALSRLEPVFQFLASDLGASPEQCRGLIVRCPDLLFSDAEHCLKPTLDYLRRNIGLENLQVPSVLSANLLNVRVGKLREKVGFLREVGFDEEEAARCCRRVPAVLKYGVESNLRRKYVYLVEEMGRGVEEVKEFPQYFGFSLERRIAPRHLHLKGMGKVRVKLNRMLVCSDEKFYARWKKKEEAGRFERDSGSFGRSLEIGL